MELSPRWLVICAVLVCSCSVHRVLSVDRQHGFPIRIKELSHLRGASEAGFKQGGTRDTVKCKDHHVYNGSMCVCSEGSNGTGCRFSIDYNPVTVKQRVNVDALLDHEYQGSFNNSASTEYKKFVQGFIAVMEEHYREPVQNASVTVTAISEGPELPEAPPMVTLSKEEAKRFSVNIMYQVIVLVPNNNTYNSTEVENAINNANAELSKNSTGSFQFFGTPNCTALQFTATDICRPDYFYIFKEEETRPHNCLTVCNPEHTDTKPCRNDGICLYHKEEGRICKCRKMNSMMYLNDDCELPIQTTGLFAGLSVMFLIILLIISVLVVRVVANRPKRVKKEDMKEKLVNQWTSDGVARPGSTFFATEGSGRLNATTYQMNRPISGDVSWEA